MIPRPDLQHVHEPRPGDFCLICGGIPETVGVFVPENSGVWGAPEGKTRIMRYCLCAKCAKKKNIAERVEKIIRAELSGGGFKC